MVLKKRPRSLKMIFLQYLFAMALTLITAVLIPYVLFILGINTGLYNYANSSEVQAENAKPKIALAKSFDSSLIPPSCTYVFISDNYEILQSNMVKDETQKAVLFAKGKYNSRAVDDCYLAVKRKDGICILHYYIRSRYTAPWMNRYLPNVDSLILVISIINCLAGCLIVTTLFAKRLKKQLQPLVNATEIIKSQNLDFEVGSSNIKEFNNILLSISDMKNELRHSLEHQWKMEQIKKEQTSLLAHDIKTPLTIIRGNSELLNDTKLNNEQREYNSYILKNTEKMELYLKMLIDLTRAGTGYKINLQKISTSDFIIQLIEQTKGLASTKKLKVNYTQINLPKEFTADTVLLQRAIMNVISNAADYTPLKGKINILVDTNNNSIRFCVIDSGKGFSKEDLRHASSQFYMGDKSRGSKSHFGIGLYITDTIVKLHNGTLHIENSSETNGGEVTIEIPLNI